MAQPDINQDNGGSNSPSKGSNSSKIQDLTQANPTKSNAIEMPSISLPKGGGALKGIDEKFEVNAANGTASLSIPRPITPGRNGFSPALSLNYNSGAGNGPFGLGWSVGPPSIQRRADKKLPRYRDGMEENIFMLAGAKDLVPSMVENETTGEWEAIEKSIDGYSVNKKPLN